MDTANLKAFVSVADNRSFSQAAEQLHLTQPAITRRIQILELETDTRLFDRIGRQVLLTDAGRCLLPNARKILDLISSSRQMLDDLTGEVRGQLRLLTSHHIGLHRLPEVLKEFKQRFPLVKLHMQFFNSQETQQRIANGDGDIGVTTLEPGADNLVTKDVWLDRLHFVVAPEHPLARRKHTLSLRELSAYPAILPNARFHTGRIVRELFEQRNVPLALDNDLSTDYLETIKALIAIGESWSVLPHTMLDDRFLVPLKIHDVRLERKLVCVHHRDRSLNSAARAFLEVLNAHRDQAA